MNENDRARILNMLKDGIITVEEAQKLLTAGEVSKESPAEEVSLKDARGRKGKKFRIVVDAGNEKMKAAKVNISIPLSIIRTIGPIIVNNLPKATKDELLKSGVDIMQIMNDVETIIDSGFDEDIVNVDTGEGEEKAKVRIYVE
ncbi:MAG: hypothetical protein EOM76_08375 [Sphingobacteriia bacterium]|nr:hypothetical protein [Sphingobacteriia bacterium]